MSQSKTSIYDKPTGPLKPGQFTKIPQSSYTEWKSALEAFTVAVTIVQQSFNDLYKNNKHKEPTNAMDDMLGNLRNVGNLEGLSTDQAREVCTIIEKSYQEKKVGLLQKTNEYYGASAVAGLEKQLQSRVEGPLQSLRKAANGMP